MACLPSLRRAGWLAGAVVLLAAAACAPEYRPTWLGGTAGSGAGGTFGRGGKVFSDVLLTGRTFTNGVAVATATFHVSDMSRARIGVDFNRDGQVDPVVAYGGPRGVFQILLSQGVAGRVGFVNLTLDGGENAWRNLADVAVGDIDGDGNLDLIGAAQDGLIYMRHPSDRTRTHVLSEWGHDRGALELLAGSTDTLSPDEQFAIVQQNLGPLVNLDNYVVTVEQGYTRVIIADFDNDGRNDVAASRRLRMSLEPAPGKNVQPVSITAGSIQVLFNPGNARTGEGWTATIVSQHERHAVSDREGAAGLFAADLDGDGDLDLVSLARDDVNAQVAWFENPGGPGRVDTAVPWRQYRIGSIRRGFGLEVADLTGDGRLDVVAISPEQKQMVLFVQPSTGPKRAYDWFSAPIATFASFEPLDVKALDVDADGVLELIVGGTGGALRAFESPTDPTTTWAARVITTFDPPGNVGLIGYGDLDGDGDLDLLAVVNADDDLNDRLMWVRNELIR